MLYCVTLHYLSQKKIKNYDVTIRIFFRLGNDYVRRTRKSEINVAVEVNS